MADENDIVYRLRKRERAEIRRQIKTRKSVQEGKPDRLANLLDEAALEIQKLRGKLCACGQLFLTKEQNEECSKLEKERGSE